MVNNSIRIIIKQEPVAKGRAKTVFKDGMVRTYTPAKTLNAQNFITERLKRHQDKMFPIHVPVKLVVTFFRTKSKWLKKSETLPVRKPDTDNFLKTVCDAMNGVLVYDDSQLTTIFARKRWTDKEYGYITIKLQEDNLNDTEKERS